ncbi:hypothetical protein PghCCS26_30470 [Paenibacillus glycanilyticus]|uniref:Dibenzothiophene monooxygenase n=1 Tax=Paenibacillus glycanilyticus TaxID=126569 RepID=A0ABQ6NN05_9BACL|nr:SfnB family sulfur acquisition oxidoreductase [Paenibacillus glycanilyticus]GMK45919.1 hypothetical protein PghCCS26_30470 [Paenibacillus glycanilyticus]
MTSSVQQFTKTAKPLPHALELAYKLGGLPLDFKRRGVTLTKNQQGNELDIIFGEQQSFSVRWDESLAGLALLAEEKDSRVILGLTQIQLRGSILVRADSRIRRMQEANVIGIPRIDDSIPDPWYMSADRAVQRIARSYPGCKIKHALLNVKVHTVDHQQNQAVAQRLAEALLSGEADAVYAEGALDQGLRTLLGARSIHDEIVALPVLLTAPRTFVEQQPEAAARLLAHTGAAARWADQHADDAYRLLGHVTGVAEKELSDVFSGRLHAQLDIEPSSDKWAELQGIQDWLADNQYLHQPLEPEEYVPQELLREAQLLLEGGAVGQPKPKELSPYALTDLPQHFFADRQPARVLKTEKEALEAASRFAESVKAGASERDRERRLPLAELRELSESGLLGVTVPQSYGGAGVTVAVLTEIIRIISKADSSLGQIPQNHYYFLKSVELVGTEEQKRLFFGEVLRGALLGNAIAERGVKKDFKHMSTRLARTAGNTGYRLSGTKFYSTGALYAQWIPVAALNEEDKRVIVYVPRHAQGVTVIDDWSGIGQRTTGSGSVILRDVDIPEHYVLPQYQIFDLPNTYLAFGQILHAAIDAGIAQAAIEDAAVFVREKTRPVYGSNAERASDEPDQIRRFGELGIKLYASEALLEKAAAAIDKAVLEPTSDHVGQAGLLVDSAKYSMTETVIEITNALFETAGTASMDQKYNYDRHWRNARIHTLHDPARLKLHHVGKWVLNGEYHEYKM